MSICMYLHKTSICIMNCIGLGNNSSIYNSIWFEMSVINENSNMLCCPIKLMPNHYTRYTWAPVEQHVDLWMLRWVGGGGDNGNANGWRRCNRFDVNRRGELSCVQCTDCIATCKQHIDSLTHSQCQYVIEWTLIKFHNKLWFRK